MLSFTSCCFCATRRVHCKKYQRLQLQQSFFSYENVKWMREPSSNLGACTPPQLSDCWGNTEFTTFKRPWMFWHTWTTFLSTHKAHMIPTLTGRSTRTVERSMKQSTLIVRLDWKWQWEISWTWTKLNRANAVWPEALRFFNRIMNMSIFTHTLYDKSHATHDFYSKINRHTDVLDSSCSFLCAEPTQQKTFKRKRSLINWPFWKGSNPQLDSVPLSPTSLGPTQGRLFGRSLSSICPPDHGLPKPVMVSSTRVTGGVDGPV